VADVGLGSGRPGLIGHGTGPPPAGPDVVEVRWAPTDLDDATLEALAAEVDAATTVRIEALLRPEDRRRSRLAHVLLRRLVGASIGVTPSDVTLTRRCVVCGSAEHGKPEVASLPGATTPPPTVSLSHSGDLVVVALGPAHRPIGVDVETSDPTPAWSVLRRHVFSDSEWDQTALAVDPDRDRLRAWVRKEATSKATGHGLSAGLERVRVGEADPGRRWARARGPWSEEEALVADIDVGTGHVGGGHVAAGHLAAVAVMSDSFASSPEIRVSGAGDLLRERPGSVAAATTAPTTTSPAATPRPTR
jgi:4'-phosphopantetheinyl transferase